MEGSAVIVHAGGCGAVEPDYSPPLRFWTGAPCSPNFLSRLVALPSFMRLSVKKAAHAVVSRSRVTGNTGSLQRTWAENDVLRMLLPSFGFALSETVFRASGEKRSKRLRPIIFVPRTLLRTRGTRQRGGFSSFVGWHCSRQRLLDHKRHYPRNRTRFRIPRNFSQTDAYLKDAKSDCGPLSVLRV
jgi:hypothetical protein